MTDLFSLTKKILGDMDIEVIDVSFSASGLLLIVIDRIGGIYIRHCEQVARQLTHVFNVENIQYKWLEVSSPGVDRQLKNESDFLSFLGKRVQIKFRKPIDDKIILSGILINSDPSLIPSKKWKSNSEKIIFYLKSNIDKHNTKTIKFTIDEVDFAKLDPVLDFKGKKR